MYTQCPKCRTIFAIDEDALQASLGIVRCGRCAERFDALLTLTDRLPADPEAALPLRDPDALAPTLTASVAQDDAGATHAGVPPAPSGSTGNTTVPPPAAQPDDGWFAALSGERTEALIADAAGIPPDAIRGDAAWQVVELPVQSRDIELDSIPLVPAADAAPANDAADAEPAAFVETVPAERFSGPWTVDIPVADVRDAVADPAAEIRDVADAAGPPTEPAAPPVASCMPSAATLLSAEEPPEADGSIDDAPPPEPDDDPVLTDTDIVADAAPDTGTAADVAPAEPAEPVYVPPRHRRIRRSEWLWAAGCLVLVLGLAAQVAWANRVALVQDPATRAWALRACARIACRLPPIRDTAQLELLSRDIRPDPSVVHALSITATFRNNAPFRQPWPVVVVRLTDLDNSAVAMRRFRPAEYLPDARRRAAGIPPGTTAAVAFEVADPGQRAVSFNFAFE